MALLHYIDNEPASGEWTSKVEAGGSTITRSTDAAWPERGSYGLRCTIVGSDRAYAIKASIGHTIPAGSSVYLGLWLRVTAFHASGGMIPMQCLVNGTSSGWIYIYSDGRIRGALSTAAGNQYPYTSYYIGANLWNYIVLRVKRSSADGVADGGIAIYVNGVAVLESFTYDTFDENAELERVFVGGVSDKDGYSSDSDEIKIAADEYPQPYIAEPADEYPCAERTVVLFRQGNSDSREFADYCVSELGVPRGMLCPLPNATGDEALADYATFQTEVEADLAAWLALNTDAGTNCSCFLIGYGVPGCFTSGGVAHSAASRLMNYGTAFSSQTANPAYNPDTVARLTKTDLAGKYLCTRIDADSLAHAEAILDAGLAVAALLALPDTDTLWSDDATYRASLPCQKLRIVTSALPGGSVYTHDAMIWGGDAGDPTFSSPAGSRACCQNDLASAAMTLRANTCYCGEALIDGGYAAALGSSETADTFDAESFYEMLRIGGTLAEAFAVAIRHLDYTAVGAGDPLMTVAFQKDGHNLYRGTGDITNVDFEDPVAYLRTDGAPALLVGLGHVASKRYTYVVRPVRGGSELVTPDLSCRAEFETDGAGDWLGDRPARVDFVDAGVIDSGKIRLRWGYTTPYGKSEPADFGVYHAGSPHISPSSPQTAVSYAKDGGYAIDLGLADGETYWLAVTARSATGVESHLSEVIGPFVAKAAAPAAPDAYVGTTF